MRKIAIIGAGQAALYLANRLLKNKYDVTVISDREPEAILNGPPTGSTYLFNDSIELEKETGLDLWRNTAFYSTKFDINLGTQEGAFAFSINSQTDEPGVAIDQRLKFYEWIRLFQQNGGKFIVGNTTESELQAYAEKFDLVVVATGRGPLGGIFQKDETRSTHDRPARKLVQLYISNPQHEPTGITLDGVMGAGEIITAPFYHKDGVQGAFFLIEAVPGSIMDVFDDLHSAAEILERGKEIIRELIPWRYNVFSEAALINNEYLKGTFIPIVRKPVTAPGGKAILGLGDAIILNDPIVGQGGNNAMKMASVYAMSIIARENAPFDAAWMNQTFDDFWEKYSKYANRFSDIFAAPPSAYVAEILGAASRNPEIASDIVNGFNYPPGLFPWLDDEPEARKYLSLKMGTPG